MLWFHDGHDDHVVISCTSTCRNLYSSNQTWGHCSSSTTSPTFPPTGRLCTSPRRWRFSSRWSPRRRDLCVLHSRIWGNALPEVDCHPPRRRDRCHQYRCLPPKCLLFLVPDCLYPPTHQVLLGKVASEVGLCPHPGVLLRFRPRIGLDESLQDRILTKVRKRLSRQNSTKKCVNLRKKIQVWQKNVSLRTKICFIQ